jgi:hypothetical protein
MHHEEERLEMRRMIFREVLFIISSGGDGEEVDNDQEKVHEA